MVADCAARRVGRPHKFDSATAAPRISTPMERVQFLALSDARRSILPWNAWRAQKGYVHAHANLPVLAGKGIEPAKAFCTAGSASETRAGQPEQTLLEYSRPAEPSVHLLRLVCNRHEERLLLLQSHVAAGWLRLPCHPFSGHRQTVHTSSPASVLFDRGTSAHLAHILDAIDRVKHNPPEPSNAKGGSTYSGLQRGSNLTTDCNTPFQVCHPFTASVRGSESPSPLLPAFYKLHRCSTYRMRTSIQHC